jgi:hypothetical protein
MLKKTAPVLLLSLIIILILCSFVACGQNTSTSQQIEILNHNMIVQKFGESPDSVAVISGTAKNAGGSVIAQAAIEATFYDKHRFKISTASASIDNLNPGILWNFNIQTSGPDAWKIVEYVLTVK